MRNRNFRDDDTEEKRGRGRPKIKIANLYLRETDRGEFLVGSLGATEIHLYWNDRKEGDDEPEASLYAVERTKEQRQRWRGRKMNSNQSENERHPTARRRAGRRRK